MSSVSIKAALEVALNSMTPAMQTAWANTPSPGQSTFVPVIGVPYQAVSFKFATPDNREMGRRYQERGLMYVRLMYPLLPVAGAGTATQMARAELIRNTFYASQTFASGGITVLINATPIINDLGVDGDRYAILIQVPFLANIQ